MSWLIVIKVSLVLMLALVAVSALRRRSAAVRHALLQTALIAALAIPLLSQVLPGWRALPQPARPASELAHPLSVVGQAEIPSTNVEAVRVDQKEVAVAPLDWGGLVLNLWLLGGGLLMALLAIRMLSMEFAVRHARPLTDRRWSKLAAALAAEFGVKSRVRLRCWSTQRMPAAWGVFRPVILLPSDADGWTDARRLSVIAHEMAHVARRDVAMLAVANLACSLHWFNPLVWLLRRRLVIECEHASDDLVLAAGSPASDYADHLLETATAYRKRTEVAPVMAARSHLEERIMAILNARQNRKRVSNRRQLVLAVASAVLFAPLSALTWVGQPDNHSGLHEHWHQHSDSAQFAEHLLALGIDEDDVDTLIAGLTAADPMTRGASAWALGDIDDERVIDPLIQAGYDTDPRVRQWAVRSLSDWSAPRIAELYVNRMQDSDPEVRQWAVRGMAVHANNVRTEPLIFALDDADAEVREWAVRVLATSGDAGAQPALAGRLPIETDDDVSEWIVRSLDIDDQGIDALVNALNSDNAEVRQWAVRGLGGVRDDRAVDALIAMLNDRDDEVREWSVRGLGVCGNDRATGALQAMRQDRNADVAEWAGRSLDDIDC